KQFLRRDPGLSERRFSSVEIYPPELGCAKDGRSGMHWTPIDGTTLLHLVIDFDEEEMFDLLLAQGAEVNARANVDAEGFGGHTPIYNAVVSHGKRQASMARRLFERGASTTVRASLRKFLDWCETPRWHKALDVTPAEWRRTFPEKGWVNEEALRLAQAIESVLRRQRRRDGNVRDVGLVREWDLSPAAHRRSAEVVGFVEHEVCGRERPGNAHIAAELLDGEFSH